MNKVKFRSLTEAKALQLPRFPRALLDEAHALQVRWESTSVSRHSKLRQIYSLVDKGAAVIESLTVCSKGCAACCEIAVDITELEASYIERNTGRRMKVGVQSSPTRHSTTRCPFLGSENECTIYEYRPFACRVYYTFDDPVLCSELDTAHLTYGTESNALFKGIRHWIFDLNGAASVADIREFFGEGNARKICP